MTSAGADSLALALLRPLDDARRALLRPLAPALRALFSDRDLRVAALGVTAVASALLAALAAPLWMLLLAPLVLGVPHLVADARYLLVRQGLHRRPAVLLAVLLPASLTLAAPRAPLGVLALLGALAVARAPLARRAALALPLAALLYATLRWEPRASLAFAHAHNLVALALWAWWARRPARRRWLVPLATTLALALVASGVCDEIALRPFALRAPIPGFDLGRVIDEVSPVSPREYPLGAMRWVLAFAVMQSLHYAAWLRMIPDEDRARTGPRGFVASYRALVEDLGRPLLACAALASLALLGWACASAVAARGAYLRLAFGHGYAELALALLLALEGGARRADGGGIGR